MDGERIYNEVVRAGSVAGAVAALSAAELLALSECAREMVVTEALGQGVPVLVAAECTAEAARRWTRQVSGNGGGK